VNGGDSLKGQCTVFMYIQEYFNQAAVDKNSQSVVAAQGGLSMVENGIKYLLFKAI